MLGDEGHIWPGGRKSDPVPDSSRELASWFEQAVRAEIASLDRETARRKTELFGGRRQGPHVNGQSLFEFRLVDPLVLPEDASGTLEVGEESYRAVIVSLSGDSILLQLEGMTPEAEQLPRALLKVDETELLKRLAEALQAAASEPERPDPIEVAVFHPRVADAGDVELPDRPYLVSVSDPSQRQALKRILGSRITYIWGPPGTGKTHLLARLVAALVDSGERVLLTSHTHAAIDEALFKLVDSRESDPGPLADDPETRNGKVLRLGKARDPRVEDFTQDAIVARRWASLTEQIAGLDQQIAVVGFRLERTADAVRRWDDADRAREALATAQAQLSAAQQAGTRSLRTLTRLAGDESAAIGDVERAQKSFIIGRSGRIERAKAALGQIERLRASALAESDDATQRITQIDAGLPSLEGALRQAEDALIGADDRTQASAMAQCLFDELALLKSRRSDAERRRQSVSGEVLLSARALFATLTKTYVSPEIARLGIDTVIVDEISMAMPPLIYLAARLARKRVVLVGDFLQLPPIVRSDEQTPTDRLRTDVFHLSGLAHKLKLKRGDFPVVSLKPSAGCGQRSPTSHGVCRPRTPPCSKTTRALCRGPFPTGYPDCRRTPSCSSIPAVWTHGRAARPSRSAGSTSQPQLLRRNWRHSPRPRWIGRPTVRGGRSGSSPRTPPSVGGFRRSRQTST
jgi:hypothetical protein